MKLPAHKRIMLKLSGEVLSGDGSLLIHPDVTSRIANEIKQVVDAGVELCVVVGGGNIFRGISASAKGFERVEADQMGMLATVINALAVKDFLNRAGVSATVQSAISMRKICDEFDHRRAEELLKAGTVVIFAAGTGNPFFSTDSGAALRAAEMKCNALYKGTSVDGVYNADPKKVADAVRYPHISFHRMIAENLKVMDITAATMCRENNVPAIVFNIREEGNFPRVVAGEGTFSIIDNNE